MRSPLRFCLALAAGVIAVSANAKDFSLTILHMNDSHAHMEESKVRGKVVGGFSRVATLINKLRKENPNPILLHAGDAFQGTLYFNVYEGLSDLTFFNYIGVNAMAVGNHEFDRGVKTLANFIKNAQFPVLSSNLDLNKEPELKNLIQPSTILTVDKQKIGIVGAVTPDLPSITMLSDTISMKVLADSVQSEVDKMTKAGINKVIVLSHCGLSTDQKLADQLRDVDAIVGGHSHTLMGTVDIPNFQSGSLKYPTIVNNIPIVQAWEWGKVVGRLKLTFDDKGKVKSWQGEPNLVDEKTAEDPYTAGMMAAFKKPIEALMNQPVGVLNSTLTQSYSKSSGDSTMGSVISDAMLEATKAQGVQVAFVNAGGVRSGLEKGPVTYGKVIEVQPFGNTLVTLELTGSELLAALDHGAGGAGLLIPSRGFSYTMAGGAPAGARIRSASLNGTPIDPAKTYKVCINNFTAGGGDGHETLKLAKGARVETGIVDIEVLIAYFKANNPLTTENEGRIKSSD